MNLSLRIRIQEAYLYADQCGFRSGSETLAERKAGGQTNMQVDRQAGGQMSTDMQVGRQIGRQTDR